MSQIEWDSEGNLDGFFQVPNAETEEAAPQPQFSGVNPAFQAPEPQFGAMPNQPPLPDIVIPDGYALAGRYQNLQQLEQHAAHFQSVADRTRNEASEALRLKDLLDSNPDLYDVLAEAVANPTRSGDGNVPDVVRQAIVTDEMGNQRVDSDRLAAGVQTMVDQRLQPAMQQVNQQLASVSLAQQYQQMGLNQQELQADLAYAQQLGQLPQDQMLLLARQIRLTRMGQPQMQPQMPVSQPTPAIPRTVTSLGGHRQSPMTQQDQGAQIVNSGRRSFNQLFVRSDD